MQFVGIHGLQLVLAELQCGERQFLVELAEGLLVLLAERDPVSLKSFVEVVQQFLLLWSEMPRILVDRLHACKEALVEHDVVAVLGE